MSDNLTYDVWLPISNRADDEGLGSLTEREQTLHLCFDFVCQIDNGGLSGYGYNVDAPQRAALVSALRRINALKTAALMERADAILNSPVSPASANTREKILTIADPENELDRLDQSLGEQIDAERVREQTDEIAAAISSGKD